MWSRFALGLSSWLLCLAGPAAAEDLPGLDAFEGSYAGIFGPPWPLECGLFIYRGNCRDRGEFSSADLDIVQAEGHIALHWQSAHISFYATVLGPQMTYQPIPTRWICRWHPIPADPPANDGDVAVACAGPPDILGKPQLRLFELRRIRPPSPFPPGTDLRVTVRSRLESWRGWEVDGVGYLESLNRETVQNDTP